MAIDERARHRLFVKLEEVLDPEEASILMEHLPPVGWADVATKRDLDVLRGEHDSLGREFRLELEALEHKLTASLHAGLNQQTRTLMTFIVGFGVSVSAAVIGAAKLL